MDKKDCFVLSYPVELQFPDNDIKEVNDEEELFATLKSWYKKNSKEKEKPGLKYPVEVIFKENITKTIGSEKDMILLKEYCEKKATDVYEICFELVYPVVYTMPDGSEVTGDNEDVINTALKAWYESNPNSKEKYELAYPVDVRFKDGTIQTVNNEEEMIALKKDC